MTPEQTKVHDLAEPLATAEGLDLVDVDIRGQGGQRLVRVIVDAKGGVDLAACQRVSKALSAALDDADPVKGTYRLEVTSPGVDRPLADRRSFERVEGRDVRVIRRTADGGDATTEVTGVVADATDAEVHLDVDGTVVRIAYDDIVKATQALPW